jgi:hypothetical protein
MVATRRTGATPKGGRRRAAASSAVARTVRPPAHAVRERAVPADQLAAGVLDLKKALDQTTARFSARVSGKLGEVLRRLKSGKPAPKGVVKAMVERIHDVRLKPEKGRLKDLERIRELVEDLVAMLPGR